MIEPGQRVKPFEGAGVTLLPVHPPEVYALILKRMVQQFKVMLHESFTGGRKRYAFAVARVMSEQRRELWIGFLVLLNALRRVQVQRDVEVLFVYPSQKGDRIRE